MKVDQARRLLLDARGRVPLESPMWAAHEFTDEQWVDKVTELMLELDPDLNAHDVRDIVSSLAKYPHWRRLSPPEAAAKTFEPPAGPESP